MTTTRGVVGGRVPRTPPHGRGRDLAVALPIVLVVVLVGAVAFTSLRAERRGTTDGEGLGMVTGSADPALTAPALTPGPVLVPTPFPATPGPESAVPTGPPLGAGATPAPSISDSSSPAPVPSGGTAVASSGAVDPYQLPRYPDSDVVSAETGIDGSVQWSLVEYDVPSASQDDVREHYRTVFRESDWFVGDVDFADGIWRFTANQDLREAQVVISVDEADHVRVSAYVTEIEQVPAPTPTQRAVRQRDRDVRRDRNRPRVQRARPAPNRDRHIPRYRGDDDDDDDDDDGDDD